MKKRIFALFMSIVLTVSLQLMPVYAYDAEEHDAYLEQVLFGEPTYKDSQTESIKTKVMMLEYASYLAIDQDRGEGKKELQYLKEQKVKEIPDLADFDLTGIFYGNHRNYTHRGWDYIYIIPKGEKHDKANWPVRKKLLCSTLNKVFDFGIKNELFGKACQECNSFAALVYYVHILGDHLERDSYKVDDLTIPLARDHVSDSNPDVYWEIKKNCEILFAAQNRSATYSSFIQELDELAAKSRTLVSSEGGLNDTIFPQYKKYASELMNLLIDYIPLLLENEDFFKNEFYSK